MDLPMISKTNIERLLQQGIVNVKFIKKDGTERVMKCTLAEAIIKPYERKTEDRVKAQKDNIVSVWDVEKDAWRSVNFDTIIEVYK